MTGERLLACPHCGAEPITVTDNLSGVVFVQCKQCGCVRGRTYHPRHGHVEGVILEDWQRRSLPTALDRVIAEVEAMPVTPDALVQACKPSSAYETYQEHLLKLLRALRAEHSAGEGEDG